MLAVGPILWGLCDFSRRFRLFRRMRWPDKNPIYLGLICHKSVTYQGRHEAIVDRQIFDTVRALLLQRGATWKSRAPDLERAPLRRKVFDEFGQLMRPTFVRPKERRYNYYIGPLLGMVGANRKGLIHRCSKRHAWADKLVSSTSACCTVQPGQGIRRRDPRRPHGRSGRWSWRSGAGSGPCGARLAWPD